MRSLLVVVGLVGLAQAACSSCSGDGASSDAGSDASIDTDTDTDTDTDADSNTDSDTSTDTHTIPDGFEADAGPWNWEDLPDGGEDCDGGCEQLTFGDEVRFLEWDVWDNYLVFDDGETYNTRVVNHLENKQLLLPNVYPEATASMSNFFPAIFEQTVCYGKKVYANPDSQDVVCVNLTADKQSLIYHREEQMGISPNPPNYIDVYGTRIVSAGGCSDVMDSWPLCAFDMESSGSYQQIAPDNYGSRNSMWGDIVVWYTGLDGYYIQAYDFSTSTQFDITNDDEVQFNPRIQGNRVVYQDLRFGDGGTPMTSWAHSAVFMYDLSTHETIQITSGEWIAAFPDVYENIVIWADYRASADPNNQNSFSGVEIWGYNLDTSTEFQITNVPDRSKTTPRIWGDKVFVHMYKAGPGDAIYMFDLPDGAK